MGREELFKIAITENPTLLLQVWWHWLISSWFKYGAAGEFRNPPISFRLFQLDGVQIFKVLPYNVLNFFDVYCDVSLFICDSIHLGSLFLPSGWLSQGSVHLVCPLTEPAPNEPGCWSLPNSHGSGKGSEESPVQHLLLKESGLQTTW